MNLVETFEDVKRPIAAFGIALATAFSVSGCGTVYGNAAIKMAERDWYHVRKDLGSELRGGAKITNCRNGTGIVVGNAEQCNQRLREQQQQQRQEQQQQQQQQWQPNR